MASGVRNSRNPGLSLADHLAPALSSARDASEDQSSRTRDDSVRQRGRKHSASDSESARLATPAETAANLGSGPGQGVNGYGLVFCYRLGSDLRYHTDDRNTHC